MLVACLGKIIQTRCLSSVHDGAVVLRERRKGGNMEVSVFDLDTDAVVVRLDQKFGELSGIKPGPWKKLCDYVIIIKNNGTIHVLLVELKKNLQGKFNGYEQLRRSLPLFEYLCSVCRVECGSDCKKTEIRYALVAEKGSERLDKQPVKRRDSLPMESHRGIRIALCVGELRIGFQRLWGE